MSRALSSTWWLLAICGVLDATHATVNLLMVNPSLSLRRFDLPGAVWDMEMLAITAGACAIVAASGVQDGIIRGSWRYMALRLARSDSSESPRWSEVH